MKRNMRVGAILKTLMDYPGEIFTLNYFSERLKAAKSSISEDIVIIKGLFKELDMGSIETITGASGGVMVKPFKSEEDRRILLDRLAKILMEKKRRIPGGFLYYADILYQAHYVKDLGEMIAQRFFHDKIDYVMTIETKGITLGLMTANYLNVPLVVARKDNRVSEGATISINYVSGSTGNLSSMYCAKRAIKRGKRVLIVDDFLRGGGTVRGMMDLVDEFESEVVGVAVFIDNRDQGKKMIRDYYAILNMETVGDEIHVKRQGL